MPVYWFAISTTGQVHTGRAIFIFILLHLLIYPASNGYNSYMDRDKGSIGGVAHPQQPTRQLFYVSVGMDAVAIALSLWVSKLFALCIIIYIAASRLYSYRGIRLKKYALPGYLLVIIVQGGLTCFLVSYGAHQYLSAHVPGSALLASSLLIGGFYPITQVYQHRQDAEDGVQTISMKLGIRGTFLFCGAIYTLAMAVLWWYFHQQAQPWFFGIVLLFFAPVVTYFFVWMSKVWRSADLADFNHTMRMNWLASICTSAAFITILLLKHVG